MSACYEILFAYPGPQPGSEALRRLRRHRRAFSAQSKGSFLDRGAVPQPSGRAPGPWFHVEWACGAGQVHLRSYWRYWEEDA